MKAYDIGSEKPFRITRDGSYQLVLAVAVTGSRIISASIDTTCPKGHGLFRVEIPDDKLVVFKSIFTHPICEVDVITGQ